MHTHSLNSTDTNSFRCKFELILSKAGKCTVHALGVLCCFALLFV